MNLSVDALLVGQEMREDIKVGLGLDTIIKAKEDWIRTVRKALEMSASACETLRSYARAHFQYGEGRTGRAGHN